MATISTEDSDEMRQTRLFVRVCTVREGKTIFRDIKNIVIWKNLKCEPINA